DAGSLAHYHLAHLRHGVTATWVDSAIGRYLIAGFVERGHGLDAESIAQVFHALTVSDLTSKFASYTSPTLIVNGEHDSALSGRARTAALIPHAEHKILAGTGHCCFLENPERFNTLVKDFLDRNELWPSARP